MAIQVRDEAGLFGSSDLPALQTAAGKWPFEVHLLTSTSSPNKAAFESRVSQLIDAPNVVGIGIDPTHHFVVVHFGKETGVPASQWASVTSAGNPDFKEAHWVVGLTRIGDQAVLAKQQAQAITIQPTTSPTETSYTGWWIFGGFVTVFAAVAIYFWWKHRREDEYRRKMEELDAEIAEKRARNIEEASWHERLKNSPSRASPPSPGYVPTRVVASPSSPSVVVNQSSGGGSGDLLTGYVLGSMNNHPAPVVREIVHEPVPVPVSSHDSGGSSSSWSSSSSSSYDSGGSSSSWSSGSSYDSGGSSSSYDSGSSFGGGGFDGGGSSSSF
jgi:hypothetical protein